jgi:hypothetical protein
MQWKLKVLRDTVSPNHEEVHSLLLYPCFEGFTPRVTWVPGLATFFERYELRLKKYLNVECFLRGVGSEAEEGVECRTFLRAVGAEAEETIE